MSGGGARLDPSREEGKEARDDAVEKERGKEESVAKPAYLVTVRVEDRHRLHPFSTLILHPWSTARRLAFLPPPPSPIRLLSPPATKPLHHRPRLKQHLPAQPRIRRRSTARRSRQHRNSLAELNLLIARTLHFLGTPSAVSRVRRVCGTR
jgi:hypothetical protein